MHFLILGTYTNCNAHIICEITCVDDETNQ